MAKPSLHHEIDLMTKAHLRNVQQLAVFYTGHNEVYAINIAKVKAFIIASEVVITDTPAETDVVEGISTIRGEPILIINLDKWLHTSTSQIKQSDYKIIIYCEFNDVKVGFLVKDIVDIIEKTTNELRNTENQNQKVTYVTEVKIDGKNRICTVFNAEKLLQDIGWGANIEEELEGIVDHKLNKDKVVIIAEDSKVAQKILTSIMTKAEVPFEIHSDGQHALDRLKNINPESVGLIITDIEMPRKDGYQVVSELRDNNSKYLKVPVIVNSSMTSDAIVKKMRSLGADDFVSKGDIPRFYSLLTKYMGIKTEHLEG